MSYSSPRQSRLALRAVKNGKPQVWLVYFIYDQDPMTGVVDINYKRIETTPYEKVDDLLHMYDSKVAQPNPDALAYLYKHQEIMEYIDTVIFKQFDTWNEDNIDIMIDLDEHCVIN
jgi:hypothetical protein